MKLKQTSKGARQPVRRVALLAAGMLAASLAWGAAEPLPSSPPDPKRNLAPNFAGLSKGAKVVVMQPDLELFEISSGGVLEPKADWTDAAVVHVKRALAEKKQALGLAGGELADQDADAFADVNALHGAMAQAIATHRHGALALPTKAGQLDWSMGDAVAGLRQKTGADYALFSWVRDSYASAGRKATMILLAAAGVGIPLGVQIGYASLVDLRDGRVVWFNRMGRGFGDLRETKLASETVEALLDNFPAEL